MLAEEISTQLPLSLRGQLIMPGDVAYEEARHVYNGMIDKHPAFIVRCADVADVIAAVKFARKEQLLVAIRGGGHSGAGMGMCDNGMVIDLSLMRGIHVDPEARTVLVEGGCTLGDVDHATHAFGLALPGGIISTTGVAGLTLGGGLGYLTRQYGLTIDSLLEADVVLADGRFVKASATQNPDLFWALRGGGGNFGVVTSFLFRVHAANMVQGGPMLWPLEEAGNLLRWFENFMRTAPENISGFFAFLTVPPGPPFPEHLHLRKMCGIVWCYNGPEAETEAAFRGIRAFKTPALDLVGPLPIPAMQSMFDGLYPPGLQWYWKADFVNELSDEAITQHERFAALLPTMHSSMHLYPINGAASRIGRKETAWNYRDAQFAMVIVGVDPDAANEEKITAWAKTYWEALHPYSAGGAYVNFMMDEGNERVRATYGLNYSRLAHIKAQYDPNNLFRVNQNIMPVEQEHVIT
ncbi:FAD/FMN-containing dehydrogenase [Hymenobacter gelipurpurascens]|uniref:FAD/FMN-containing dehydrogenase n=1 Tax=Hymenobacter gelipurpurascens TaxID=89968 RepID=A0A212UCP2_9BACT|nr:FAD-binding oxidoreductase [Hymenobacter gelipurpurascens]SNC75963.1 FAD/FMN-containing dehydrogenase [Hymenobacter gelipurpurascens]